MASTLSRYRREQARGRGQIYRRRWSRRSMNRCIHCTRCVRFATEVAGVPELGAIGRGEDMEITTYLEQRDDLGAAGQRRRSLPGRRADLASPTPSRRGRGSCDKTESIDVMDALGSAIRVDTRGREVMRILPRTNDDVNEEWISDKTRHVVDGLRTQRLDQPYIREQRPAAAGELGRGLRGDRRQGEGATRRAHRRHRRRSCGGRGDVRAQGSAGAARRAEYRLPPGRRRARSEVGPGQLSVQRDHRRHRAGRRAADRRRQSAPRGGGAQCAHPQALARGQFPDRR